MAKQSLYSKRANLIIGFHGCEKNIAEKIACGEEDLKKSINDYDWLGNGVYFWENNYNRAFEWAEKSKKIREPGVLGAVIDLGYCMDLLDSEFIQELKIGYDTLLATMELIGSPMPVNKGTTPDKLLRKLDCAVIEVIHTLNEEDNNSVSYDSVRGVFWEGEEIYPGAFFKEKNHIQICVRNPNCIKGYFIPRIIDGNFIIP
ncbi:hypothetical protein [Bacteroides sp. 519]|uniref:hypothetical protein n=1 Tax=Bacteroides sp. 519 TaxID=2302937 RepID=UPI0013D30811|nr:hypothetical protein [Bacteroides sp. 519]NDV59767.1 hypothetical protein [Bacteroides sp. 519]